MTAPTGSDAPAPNALRAARLAKSWSQSEAARELAALGARRQAPVAAAASLKTLLSRWENGHAVPEPQYRALLAELFGRSPTELGFSESPSGVAGLRAAIAAATAVDSEVLSLWREQVAVARRLDDELGAAGAGGVVRALVDQLASTLSHTLTPAARHEVAALLAHAAALAGHQSLDTADHEGAWSRFDQARTVATAAALPVAAAEAAAGLAAVLVDAGEPDAALTLLEADPPAGPPAARLRWEAALGITRAAAGAGAQARAAFAAVHRTWPHITIDVVEPPAMPIELADVHRWHGNALVALGDSTAAEPLEQALAARPASARNRAALHADLATALRHHNPVSAAEHRRLAADLAVRTGSARITALLDDRRRP